MKRSGQFDEDELNKRVRYEDEGESELEESESETSEDESENEDESDTEMTETSGLPEEQLALKKQHIMAEHRRIESELNNDRARVAREGGLKFTMTLLDKLNTLAADAKRYGFEKEAQLLDSKNLKTITDLAVLGTRSVKIGAVEKSLRPREYTTKLKHLLLNRALHDFQRDNGEMETEQIEEFLDQRHSYKKLDLFSLGTFFYSRASKAISTGHLLGPLEIEKKMRQVQKRTKNDFSDNAVTAQNVTSNEINTKSTNQTANAVQECYKIFIKSKRKKMSIFEYFINPHSFNQSIENMFYTSFLIRDGRLMLEEDEDGYPVISDLPALPTDIRERDIEIVRRQALPSNHIIFQLEYETWKGLIKKFNITESFLPNRH